MPTDPTPALVHFALNGILTTSQYIYDVRISPGINTVRVAFKTVQPTIPVITCTDNSDGTVSFAFPLFGGMQTEHSGVLGEQRPLKQDTSHTLKIVAAGTNRHGQRIERKLTVNFQTGRRDATVMFDTIKVRDDSDSAGDGELELFLLAGDADSGDILGNALEWPYLEISDSDPPFSLNLTKDISHAPRRLWVRAWASDDDFSFSPSFEEATDANGEFDPVHSFRGERSFGKSTSSSDMAHITRVFDLVTDFNSDTTFSIELPTGDFALAYTVNARVHVTGTVPKPISLNPRPHPEYLAPPIDLGLIPRPRQVMKSASGRSDGRRGYFVTVGAEGAIYYAPIALEERHDWIRVPGEPAMPAKAFAGRDGRLNLFAYDESGGVLYLRPDDTGDDESWRRLGGHVSGPLAVAEARPGYFHVFGLGEDGVVYGCQFGPDDRRQQVEWQRVGEKIKGSLSAFTFAGDVVGLFALGLGGEILHKELRRDESDPPGLRWHSLGKAAGDMLLVLRVSEERGLVIATLGENDELQYLEWPDYPEREPAQEWIQVGTIEAWMESQPPRTRGARRGRLS